MGVRSTTNIVLKRTKLSGFSPVPTASAKLLPVDSYTIDTSGDIDFDINRFAALPIDLTDVIDTDTPLGFASFHLELAVMKKNANPNDIDDIWEKFSRYYATPKSTRFGIIEGSKLSSQNHLFGSTKAARSLEKAGYLTSQPGTYGASKATIFSVTPKGKEFARTWIIHDRDIKLLSKKQLDEHLHRTSTLAISTSTSKSKLERNLLIQQREYESQPLSVLFDGGKLLPAVRNLSSCEFSSKDIVGNELKNFQQLLSNQPCYRVSNPMFISESHGSTVGNVSSDGILHSYVLTDNDTLLEVYIPADIYRDWQNRFGDVRLRIPKNPAISPGRQLVWTGIEADGKLKGISRIQLALVEKPTVNIGATFHGKLNPWYRLFHFSRNIFAHRDGFDD